MKEKSIFYLDLTDDEKGTKKVKFTHSIDENGFSAIDYDRSEENPSILQSFRNLANTLEDLKKLGTNQKQKKKELHPH